MADEAKLRNQHNRGERAKRLMQDDLLQEGFTKLEEELLRQFKDSLSDEKQLREDAHRSLRLLEHIKGHLQRTMTTGDAAHKELLRIKDPSRLKRMMQNV